MPPNGTMTNEANRAACIADHSYSSAGCDLTVGQFETCLEAEAPTKACDTPEPPCTPVFCFPVHQDNQKHRRWALSEDLSLRCRIPRVGRRTSPIGRRLPSQRVLAPFAPSRAPLRRGRRTRLGHGRMSEEIARMSEVIARTSEEIARMNEEIARTSATWRRRKRGRSALRPCWLPLRKVAAAFAHSLGNEVDAAHHLREADPRRQRTRGRVAGAPPASDEAGPAPRAGCTGRATRRQSVPEGLRGPPRVTARTYASPETFKQALEQRLRSPAANGPDFARRRQLLGFERFLARVVAVLGDAATLKGGLVLELRLDRAKNVEDLPDRLPAKLLDARPPSGDERRWVPRLLESVCSWPVERPWPSRWRPEVRR